MPYGSALGRAVDPSQEWTQTDYLLHAIEFDLRVVSWQLAGNRNAKRPRPLDTPATRSARERAIARETPERRARVDEILNRIQIGGDA